MEQNQEVMNASGEAQCNGDAPQDKTFQERLSEIPLYTMTLNQLCSMYSSLKERNEVLNKALSAGEYYAKTIADTAKPVVASATTSALAAAKPVIGEVTDPAAALDSVASRTLAEAGKKFPILKSTPTEIAESTKEAIKSTANSYLERFQESTTGKTINKQVDNAISLSELVVEICFPTDGSDPEQVAELEKEEMSENAGHAVRVSNLKEKVKHRGRKRLMTLKPVQITVDAVEYAQERIADMNGKLSQGTNYVKEKTEEAKEYVLEKKSETEEYVGRTKDLLKKQWDAVYDTTMYIPSKAIQISGEVFVSTREIVFSYAKAHSVTEVPYAMAEMMEQHYSTLKEVAPQFTEVTDKAVAYVLVPAQVVSEYILSSRPVQWIIPTVVKADSVKIMEDIEMSELEGEIRDKQ